MNEKFTDEIKIYVEPFYFRNLYYLIKTLNIKKIINYSSSGFFYELK